VIRCIYFCVNLSHCCLDASAAWRNGVDHHLPTHRTDGSPPYSTGRKECKALADRLKGTSVDRMSRNDDISTRGGANAKRIALDRAVILAAQLQILGSMAKAHDAEYCTHGRDKNVAVRQLEELLPRVETDHLDIWQIHKAIYENDRDLILASNGVAEMLHEAKRQGLLAGSDRTLVQPE
jgi:hypothetical protein